MTDLFPIIQPEAEPTVQEKLPLCREVAWDFDTDRPKWRNGSPVWVTGAQAVATWRR